MRVRNLLSVLATAALITFVTSCTNNETTDDNKQESEEITQSTTFIGGTNLNVDRKPSTRTSLDVTLPGGSTVDYYWEQGDKIWTADGANGEAQITAKAATAKFQLSKAYTTPTVELYYPGKNATAYNQVTIATTQTQTTPNNTAHLGEAGDCGTATATRQADGSYQFNLDHKATYLCFLPRTSNTLTSTTIWQIKITADNNIAGTYTLSNTGLAGSGSSNTITVITSGYHFGWYNFPLNNKNTSQSTNAIYAVIAPGTHTLNIEYTLVDGNTRITVIKTIPSAYYAENTVYPITSNFSFTEYPGDQFYTWDAAEGQNYWKGHEDSQPKTEVGYGEYPRNASDPRWFNNNAVFPNGASQTAKDCPNVNEAIWYMERGDPHWDDKTPWVLMGHLYHRGVWIKKKDKIAGFDANHAPNGEDYSSVYSPIDHPRANFIVRNLSIKGRPSDVNDYFYLPLLGYYQGAAFRGPGEYGQYWTSTTTNTRLGVSGVGGAYMVNIQLYDETLNSIYIHESGSTWGNTLWQSE